MITIIHRMINTATVYKHCRIAALGIAKDAYTAEDVMQAVFCEMIELNDQDIETPTDFTKSFREFAWKHFRRITYQSTLKLELSGQYEQVFNVDLEDALNNLPYNDVAKMLYDGHTSRDIMSKLHISSTKLTHRKNAIRAALRKVI